MIEDGTNKGDDICPNILKTTIFEWITTSDGRRVQVLRDGHTARASFFDAVSARGEFMTDAERHVMEDAEWRARAGGNRPVRVLVGAELRAARQTLADAYRLANEAAENAWRNPTGASTGAGEQQFVGQAPGDLVDYDTNATDTNFAFFASVASASVCAPAKSGIEHARRVEKAEPRLDPSSTPRFIKLLICKRD